MQDWKWEIRGAKTVMAMGAIEAFAGFWLSGIWCFFLVCLGCYVFVGAWGLLRQVHTWQALTDVDGLRK